MFNTSLFWLICSDNSNSGYFISKKRYTSWREAENEYANTVYAKSFENFSQLLEFLLDDQIIITSQSQKICDFASDPTRAVMDLAELDLS